MGFANYHTHCSYCDGEMGPEDYIIKAIELGFDAIGFSSHAPLPFYSEYVMEDSKVKDYLYELNELKNKYKNKLQVYTGLEIDYLPGIMGPDSSKFKTLNLDYTIGSVHYIHISGTDQYFSIDESEDMFNKILVNVFDGDIKEFIKKYY